MLFGCVFRIFVGEQVRWFMNIFVIRDLALMVSFKLWNSIPVLLKFGFLPKHVIIKIILEIC